MNTYHSVRNCRKTLKHPALALALGAALFGAAPSASAAPPVSGYARWFDASQIAANNGDAVSTWNDLSANAANATVPGGNATPVYVANAGTETGLGAVYFAGNGGAGNSAALKFTEDTGIRTVFSVFKGCSFLLTDTSQYHFHRPSDNNAGDALFAGYASGNITGGSTYVNGTLVNATSAAMPTNVHNGFNLVEILTTGTVQADSFNKDRVYHSGNQYQAEVIIYDRLLSEDERVEVEHYLMTKWFNVSYAPEAKITSFGPGASVAQPVGGSANIAWTVSSSMPVTSLAPTFTLSAGATCTLASGSTHDFTGPVEYTVTSSDSLITNHYFVTVSVAALPVVTNLNAWYDADSGVTTSGTTVTGWDDQSGNGNHATVGDGNPALAASQINGHPAVQFRGNNLVIDHNITPGQEFIVLRSGRYSYDGGNPSHWGSDWGGPIGQQNDSGWMLQPDSEQMWDGNAPNAVSVNGTSATKNGNNWHFANDVNQYMVLKVNPANSGAAFGRLGRPNNSWGNGQLDVAEVIVYTSPLSEDDEDRVGGYLASKYAIASAYPPTTPSAIIKRFGPAENPAVVDQTAHSIDWYVPFGTDVTSLAPPYKLVYSSTCDKASGSSQNFSSPVTYTVKSSDNAITTDYVVTVHVLPNWPTLINVNYSGDAGTASMDGIYSYDSVARGSASRVAPAAYSGNRWNDFVGNSTATGSNLIDSQGVSTNVGLVTTCNNGPWADWTGLGTARILKSAVLANYTSYAPIFTLTGLDTGHAYDIYIASRESNNNKPADFLAMGVSKRVALATTTDWADGDSYVKLEGVIPSPSGEILVKARCSGDWDGIVLNAFQVQDMGARGLNSDATLYSFSFPGIGAATISGTSISLVAPYGTDLTTLAPTYEASTGATSDKASGSSQNFSSPLTYTITSENGSNTTIYTVTVTAGPPPPGGVGSGLVAWFDASQIAGLSDSDPVAVWQDISGHAHSAMRAEGNMTYAANQLNSLPTVQFRNGASAGLTGSLFSKEQYVVFKITGGDWGSVLGSQSGSGYLLNPNGSFWDGHPAVGVSQNGTVMGNAPYFNLNNPGDFMVLKITGNSDDPNVRSGWALGRQEGWHSVDMDLAEIIAFDHALTSPDEANVGGYLTNKYHLTTTYPTTPRADMLGFTFPTYGAASVIGTDISITVPQGTDVTALSPSYTLSPGATCDRASGSTQDFTGVVSYSVTNSDSTITRVYHVSVAVLPSPPVASGLACWYAAGYSVTASGSGTVQTWADISGNGRDATSGGGSVSLVPSDVNSLPAVHLRSGGYMNCTTVPFTSIVKEQFVVVRSPKATWSGGSFFGRKSDDFLTVRGSSYNMAGGTTGFWQDHFPVAVSKNGKAVSMNAGHDNQGNSSNGCGFALDTITDYMILKIVVDNDGVANFASYPYYQIGKNEGTGTTDFDVAEIMGFSTQLSSEDEATVTNYLTNKYLSVGGYADWAATNVGGQTADQDYNNDGIANGIAYFMGATGRVTNPGVVGGKVAWPHSASATGITYKVFTSANLENWTDDTAAAVDAGGFLTYTLVPGSPTRFVRLEVQVP